MEFPPEILAIIREYYQPCFKYGILYKRILELSKFGEWSKLKEVLQSNPNAILSFNLEYENAQMEWLTVCRRPPSLYTNTYGDYTPDQWLNIKLSIRNRALKMLALKINAET